VADRTKALATSTEVSRRLSTILNEKQLVIEVVEQVKAAFDYYHVHIYMMDKTSGDLIMAGGTGDAGATMLESGHKIPRGRGLVGRAAQNNIPVLVSDTSQDPSWLPNPLLPETRSEVAVPIATADEVLGVLDVQQNEVGGLKQEDVDLLQSLANQVAIALLNARSYVDIQQRADREARITSIGLKIKSTTSIEAALKATVRELGRTLDANDIQAILEAPGLAQHSQKPD
jgi:GAF domain-containing protein